MQTGRMQTFGFAPGLFLSTPAGIPAFTAHLKYGITNEERPMAGVCVRRGIFHDPTDCK